MRFEPGDLVVPSDDEDGIEMSDMGFILGEFLAYEDSELGEDAEYIIVQTLSASERFNKNFPGCETWFASRFKKLGM